MRSSGFDGFHLSDLEKGVRSHHDHIRSILPVTRQLQRPPEDQIAHLNDSLWESQMRTVVAVA